MKIVYCGNFQPGQVSPPPWSTETDYQLAFESLGHEVVTVQENDPDAVEQIRAHAFAGETRLVLLTRTWGLPYEAACALWADCADGGIVTAAVHLDRWWGLDRQSELKTEAQFKMRHVFTADGDHADDWIGEGIHHHWLPPGVRGSEAHDSEAYPPWVGEWDVAFVGSSGYHPEWGHRPEMVEWLRKMYGPRFIHIGPGSPDFVTLDTGEQVDRLRGHQLNRFYRSVPIIVGDSCLVRREGRYWSDRVPETWGRGGFLIHPGVDALAEDLGEEYPGFGWDPYDWDTLEATIGTWLAAPDEREATRQRLATRIRTTSTYAHRAADMLARMSLHD